MKHGPDPGSFYVASVQRNPVTEVPEAPSTENRVENRNSGVAAVIERPEVALCLEYPAVRPVPRVVPTTGRRRTVPATRRRGAVPVRRRPTGGRPIIPAEPSRWRRRRRAVVACAEAARRIPGTAHLRITAIVSAPREIALWSARPRPASSRPASSRPARPRPPRPRSMRRSARSRSPRTRPRTRPARSWRVRGRPVPRSAKTRSALLTKRGRLEWGGVGQLSAYRQC